jgi:GTP-binding protein
MRTGEEYNVARVDDTFSKHKITKLFSFSGLKRTDIDQTQTGDIVAIAGIPGITIGESFCDVENPQPLPRIAIDDPTIAIQFNVNNSPFAGREGRWVTSRNLRDRLDKETAHQRLAQVAGDRLARLLQGPRPRRTPALHPHRDDAPRGFRDDGLPPGDRHQAHRRQLMEPVEQLMIDIPENFVGTVIERLGPRKGEMTKMTNHGSGRVSDGVPHPQPRPHRPAL